MKKLETLLEELESKIPDFELTSSTISKSSVGWHIEHSLLTFNAIIDAIKKSNPDNYQWTFNWKRIFVLTIGKIPRGRAKAPTRVQPTVHYNINTLTQHLILTKDNLRSLESAQPNQFFLHPFFGELNLKPTIRFLLIHTRHHLDIINDIIKSKK